MRWQTGNSASRKRPPALSIEMMPRPGYVHVDFGGLSLWLSEPEATALGQQLIEAGIRIRNESKEQDR